MSSPMPARHRSSKACETCRARRVKCSGNTPCATCLQLGKAETCRVRHKARPNRPVSQRHRRVSREPAQGVTVDIGAEDPTLTLPDPFDPVTPARGSSERAPPDSPEIFGRLSERLREWCTVHAVPAEVVSPEDTLPIASYLATPLPPEPQLYILEETLTQVLLAEDEEREHFHWVDADWIVRLYRRFRALPKSVAPDERAVLYATFCVARLMQLARDTYSGSSFQLSDVFVTREDLTYYRMALDLVTSCQPSLYCIWALYCLLPYTFAVGSSHDTRQLARLMARHVCELGLHRTATADLYDEKLHARPMFSAFFYIDTLSAGLTDLTLSIPLEEIDDELLAQGASGNRFLLDATLQEARLLSGFCGGRSPAGQSDMWTGRLRTQLRLLRSEPSRTNNRQSYHAELRYNWLIVLVSLADQASGGGGGDDEGVGSAELCRSVAQILYVYKQLASNGRYHASWPQLRICGIVTQLLVLQAAAGELQGYEAELLLGISLELLEKHRASAPRVDAFIQSLRHMAGHLGIGLPAQQTFELGPTEPLIAEGGGLADWWTLDFLSDIPSFVTS